MIVFKLRCGAADHEFEAWFRDGAAYDKQSAAGKITCPECGSTRVEKAPMAPSLGRSRAEPAARPATPPAAPPPAAKLRQMLQELRRHVESNCENVGDRFAEEARRIHYGETESRGIYGEASDEDSRSLADEGIEVARIPWVPSTDA